MPLCPHALLSATSFTVLYAAPLKIAEMSLAVAGQNFHVIVIFRDSEFAQSSKITTENVLPHTTFGDI